MESKNELQTNKKGNASIVVIIILILLVLALSGYICYDKFLSKEDNTKVTNNDSNEKEDNTKVTNNDSNAKETDVTTNEDNNTVAENNVTTNEENDTKKYVNKVYANANTKNYIVLFNDGKCVITSNMNYTAKCNYYIEDNKIYLTRSNVGASRYDNKTNEVYKIFNDENNNENIINENSTDENSALKYLK